MNFLTKLFLFAPGILLAITVHEVAHGWVADRLGDPTARLAGRLTLNPLVHLDPLGTLMLFIAHFGWAKPVPINPNYFKDPKRDIIWVSLAGPAANILAAALCGVLFRWFNSSGLALLSRMAVYAVLINLILAVFNLIPIPPLDGSKVLMGLLPAEQEYRFHQLERWGPLILIGIIFLNRRIPVLSLVIFPFVNFLGKIFTGYRLL
ncbi:MAG: site-2 protease family protein [Candidatus Latescibacteria bacterium]|nr:site-2 protease family protein [Candidatus Latescibacterota bacterium]